MMKTDKLVRCALIAAVYAAVCLALPFLSYGPVQIRFSEALTLLPVLMPEAVVGLTLGCFLANLIGVFMGTTMAVDVCSARWPLCWLPWSPAGWLLCASRGCLCPACCLRCCSTP